MGKPISSLKAVDDVSFKIKPGETLGIVGESGCGKTTMGRTILKLYQPTAGQIFFEGKNIADYKPKEMRGLRTKMQIVFQDPYSSLPPRSTVGDILSEPVRVHHIVPPSQVKEYVLKVMEQCGLRDYYYERHPHEFSGGQRQRISIARAILKNPPILILDEATSALDTESERLVQETLERLMKTRTTIAIAHRLSTIKNADEICVLYEGEIVERGKHEELLEKNGYYKRLNDMQSLS